MFLKSTYKAIIWAIIIMVACTIPGNEVKKASFIHIPNFDKIVHLGFYFILSILIIGPGRYSLDEKLFVKTN